jgi:poly [ADP-ribose] polymerase
MSIIKSKNYILSELSSNRNKFYSLSLHSDQTVTSRYGRVGDAGQQAVLGQGEALFDAKCREKEKKGYREQKTLSGEGALSSVNLPAPDLREAATQQIATNSPEARRLIEKLVAANVHSILQSTSLRYNAQSGTFSTPLGLVTQDALDEARRYLRIIGDCVGKGNYGDSRLLLAANSYLTLVPQNIGRTRKSVRDLYPDLKSVQAQNDLLDKLATSLQLALTQPAQEGDSSQGAERRVFEAALHLVQAQNEFEELNDKFKSTLNRNHASAKLRLKRAYSVEIASMRNAFEAKGKSKGCVMELWHGTGIANILSILHSGLQIQPPSTAHVTGKMFSAGAYFGIQSTKSLAYSYGAWNGTRNKICYLFLCSVALGKFQVPHGATSKRPDQGYDSYWAKPGISGIQNDEIVVFDAAQINPRYLLEFSED